MGSTGIPDGFRRADCDICRKPAASSEIDWRAGVCGGGDIGFVRGGGESRRANRVARRDVFVENLGLFAGLVSPSVFFFFLFGDGGAGASCLSRFGGRPTDFG